MSPNLLMLRCYCFLIALLACLTLSQSAKAEIDDSWRQLKPGLLYQDLGQQILSPWSHIHVFKLAPEKYQLSLSFAQSLDKKIASIDELAEAQQALIAINGGFFDRDFKSLGLRIHQSQQVVTFKPISWWGIFLMKNQRPYIVSARAYRSNQNYQFAIQAGPRLIIDGRIPSLKGGQAERSALGVTRDGQIIVLVTDKASMSTTKLAELMKQPPLSCVDALNLDGGSSSQLYAKIEDFRLNVHGFSNVSDAVVVKER